MQDSNQHDVRPETQQSEMTSLPAGNSLSPEYKALWSDIHIEGNYDQFARKTHPPQESATEPPVADAPPPPQEGGSEAKDNSNGDAKCRNRAAAKALLRPPAASQQPPKSNFAKIITLSTSQLPSGGGGGKHKPNRGNPHDCEPPLEGDEADKQPSVTTKSRTKDHVTTKQAVYSSVNHHHREFPISILEFKPSETIRKRYTRLANHELAPAIASLVDYGDNLSTLNEDEQLTARDGSAGGPAHRPLSRMSAVLMAHYLGVGGNPLPNIVTSIVVKPVLPPLRHVQTQRFPPPRCVRRDPRHDDVITDDVKRLATPRRRRRNSVKSKYLDKVKGHGGDESKRSGATKQPPSIFDSVVRWRSRARMTSCRRVTSPTLGEVALRRKLTDRLPTRKVQKRWPDINDLEVDFELDSAHLDSALPRPPHDDVITSERAFPQPRTTVRDAFRFLSRDSLAPSDGSSPPDEMMRRHKSVDNEHLMSLPDVHVRRRRPIWQRMR